jgi:hypothetical protein
MIPVHFTYSDAEEDQILGGQQPFQTRLVSGGGRAVL